jgi:hypothetical protein
LDNQLLSRHQGHGGASANGKLLIIRPYTKNPTQGNQRYADDQVEGLIGDQRQMQPMIEFVAKPDQRKG